jgi:hypothetical protein
MQDIRRQDRRLFFAELLRAPRLFLVIVFFVFVISFQHSVNSALGLGWVLALCALPLVALGLSAYNASIERRFLNKRFQTLWMGCQDRLQRFEAVLGNLRREQIADLQEMPRTIHRVGDALYLALRRADLISFEVQKTEQGIYSQPPAWTSPADDPQARELYRIADKNIAEYRQQFAGVMAGVHRAEAQSAVFMTTLDTLRMKMLGYRLVGKSPELSSHDFLEALGEAKLQLQAIDRALDELDFSHMPRTIAVVPAPPVVQDSMHQGNNG